MYFNYFYVYLLIINVITFFTYGLDKFLAIKQKRRIRITTLLGVAFIGGEVGGMIAMKVFHHKTNKFSFRVGLPLILLFHIILLVMIYNY